ncbi:MAG: biotin/lipoyl-containing protein, partial [Pseudomonadota bacterium]
ASHTMYPKVFADFAAHQTQYGDVSILPTHVFLYGMRPREELTLAQEPGKQVLIRYLTKSEPDDDGVRRVFFEINGQPRSVRVNDSSLAYTRKVHEQADASNPMHVAAPMPGLVASVAVAEGDSVERGDTLLTLEAMKMETAVTAERAGKVKRVVAPVGTQVDVKDLLVELAEG